MSNKISKTGISFFQNQILSWFEVSGRHHLPWREEGLSPYEIVIAEVLLQRTKAETVEKFYPKFLSTFPSWETINSTDILFLEQILKPVGLFRQRAQRLKKLAAEMARRKGELPQKQKELEQIPLLGQYITNAIILQVFHRPSPLIDVNMARVLERHFGERKLADIRYDSYLQALAAKIVNHSRSKEINWGILDFAASVCKARGPLCTKCPFSNTCKFYKKSLS